MNFQQDKWTFGIKVTRPLKRQGLTFVCLSLIIKNGYHLRMLSLENFITDSGRMSRKIGKQESLNLIQKT